MGGLTGGSVGTLRNVYTTGSVSSGTSMVGGLVGWSAEGGRVIASYSTASVTSGATRIGGLVGLNGGTATITASYATGMVTAAPGSAGWWATTT